MEVPCEPFALFIIYLHSVFFSDLLFFFLFFDSDLDLDLDLDLLVHWLTDSTGHCFTDGALSHFWGHK